MKLFFDENEFKPLHVIGKCSGPVWPVRKLTDAWKEFGLMLKEISGGYRVKTHAFVMMRNHYHWLATVPPQKTPTEDILKWFHEAINFDVQWGYNAEFVYETGEDPPQMFDDPPNIVKLEHIEAYRQAYAYVYRNPVKAGIVTRAETYPFSTLPYVLGRHPKKLKFTCLDNMNLIYDPQRLLEFINGDEDSSLDAPLIHN
jgi:putative transposase